MAFRFRGFVYSYLCHFRIVFLLAGCLSIVLHHSPELVIIHLDNLRDLIDRHLSYQGHGKGLKEKSEVRSIPCPWHINLENPVSRTINPRHSHHQVAGILEEAEMSPLCLLYTSDAADDLTRVDLGGRRIIKK